MVFHKALKQFFLAIAVLLGACLTVQAQTEVVALDEIVLKNGSRVLGTVSGVREGVVVIETEFAGTLNVALDQIKALRSDHPAVILLTDGSVLPKAPFVVEEEVIVITGGSAADSTYPLTLVSVVNPEPWELGKGYRWTGSAGAAFSMERGNTDSDELDYRIESIWRSLRDRFTFLGSGQRDEVNGERNADNWKLSGKYDYFLTDPVYVGVLVSTERDKFADLDARYLVGPFIGRQFFDDPGLSLAGELGLSYVREEFFVAEDDEYGAGTWALHAASNVIGGDSRLYFDQTGIWNLENTSNVSVDTIFGLSFPLMWSLDAAAEVLLEYDSGSPDDVDELDRTYRFRVGYTW